MTLPAMHDAREINDDLDNAVDVVAVLQNNSNANNNDNGLIPQLIHETYGITSSSAVGGITSAIGNEKATGARLFLSPRELTYERRPPSLIHSFLSFHFHSTASKDVERNRFEVCKGRRELHIVA